jgi:ferredoxin
MTPRPAKATAVGPLMVVDPIACDGHGLCAEILPEWIGLDDWGYPVIPREPLPPHLRSLAERAIKACPTLALRLQAVEQR